MKKINPNQVCDFLILDKEQDEYGSPKDTWKVKFPGVFCEVSPILGYELFQAMTSYATVDAKIRARWFPGVTNDMRVMVNDTLYDIVSAIDVGTRHEELLCYVKAVRE